MKPLLFGLFMAIGFFANAQNNLVATTGDIYIGKSNKNFYGSFNITSGSIKKGQKIEIYAETGRKFICTITKITGESASEVKEAKAGEYAYCEFNTDADATTGKDYLRRGYRVVAAGAKVEPVANNSNKPVQLETILDGAAFKANVTYKGASLWRKGLKGMYNDRPYLQLQFNSTDAVDNRIFTILILNPKEDVATYSEKDMEINFSGSKDGNKDHTTIYGFVNGKAKKSFTMQITQWKKVSANKAIISGTFSGDIQEVTLFGNGKKTNSFKEGKFTNVEVEVFSKQEDMKEMMKAAGLKQ